MTSPDHDHDHDPTTLPALVEPRPRGELDRAGADDLLADFRASLKPQTRRAYTLDLEHFARFLQVPDSEAAVAYLLALDGGEANRAVMRYRDDQIKHGAATASVGRRLAAIKSVTKLAGMLGLVAWSIKIRAPKVEPRRDVRGPDPAEFRKIYRAAAGDTFPGRRNRAILALLYDLALRANEVCTLRLQDLDLDHGTVAPLRKGKTERARLTLPGPTRKALADWVFVRGTDPGPLFYRLDRGTVRVKPGDLPALTVGGLEELVETLAKKARVRRVTPHGLRHSAITAALDAGVDIRDVRKYSGHANLNTVLKYDDARDDVAGRVARKVAGDRR